MKNFLRIAVSLSAFLALSLVVFADVSIPTMTRVYFTKDAKPVTGPVEYKVTCYGYNSYPGDEEDFGVEKKSGSYSYNSENVYEYSAKCGSYGCNVYEGYDLNYSHIDYCNLTGTYEGKDFEIRNFAKTPIPTKCDDLKQYDELDSGKYYKYTEEYDQCLIDNSYNFSKCAQYKEQIPKSTILVDPFGSSLERICEVSFDIPSVVAKTTVKVAFSDVAKENSNYDAINYVKEGGFVTGYVDGTFKPNNKINRAEFIKILLTAHFGEEEINECLVESKGTDAKYVYFKDVPLTEWFAKYVCEAKRFSIIGGYSDGNFKPEQHVNFAEAAKIIVNTMKYNTVEVAGEWYLPFVMKLYEFDAVPETIKDYGALLTRGEMAEIIYRLKIGVINE